MAGPPPAAHPFTFIEGGPNHGAHQHLARQPRLRVLPPKYAPPDRPQQIRIVFGGLPGYVPTALVALSLVDVERLCSQLNARLGLDRHAWMTLAAKAMRDSPAPRQRHHSLAQRTPTMTQPVRFMPFPDPNTHISSTTRPAPIGLIADSMPEPSGHLSPCHAFALTSGRPLPIIFRNWSPPDSPQGPGGVIFPHAR